MLRGRRVRLRGSKIILQQSYTPPWIWIAVALVLWNALMAGWFIPNKLVEITVLLVGFALSLVIPLYFSIIYVVTDKEIAIIRRYGKIERKVGIDSTVSFKVVNLRRRSPISNPKESRGDIAVYDAVGNVILTLKGVRSPVKVVKLLRSVSGPTRKVNNNSLK